MIILENKHIRVQILHPEHDRAMLGSRYCTGGYIRQVEHTSCGPLFSGPAFPDPSPPTFDGQGAPEAFTSPLSDPEVPVGETVTMIGVGEVLRSSPITPFNSRQNPTVRQFCSWQIVQSPDIVAMTTRQQHIPYQIALTRTVQLSGCTLISKTTLSNNSDSSLPIVWFPHPFFPLNTDLSCCRFHFDYLLPENPAYYSDNDGTLRMKPEYNWNKGLFLKTETLRGVTFKADINHPKCRNIEVTGDYPLAFLPFWANANTFSPEPYMEQVIAAEESVQWSIRYSFIN